MVMVLVKDSLGFDGLSIQDVLDRLGRMIDEITDDDRNIGDDILERFDGAEKVRIGEMVKDLQSADTSIRQKLSALKLDLEIHCRRHGVPFH